jgi:hypothetical protein
MYNLVVIVLIKLPTFSEARNLKFRRVRNVPGHTSEKVQDRDGNQACLAPCFVPQSLPTGLQEARAEDCEGGHSSEES